MNKIFLHYLPTMTPSLRLPAVLTAFTAVALFGPRTSAADEKTTPAAATPAASVAIIDPVATATPAPTPVIAPAQHAAAEALVAAMHTQQTVENANKQMEQSIEQVVTGMSKMPNVTPEQTTELQKMREETSALVAQKLGWDTMKEDVIQSYAVDFTEAELKEITAFYHSPAGEKLVAKQPELAEKLTRTMRQRSMTVVPVIRQKIQALSMKLRPPMPVHPVATPGAPMASPAMPAVPAVPQTSPAVSASPAASVTTIPVPAPTP